MLNLDALRDAQAQEETFSWWVIPAAILMAYLLHSLLMWWEQRR